MFYLFMLTHKFAFMCIYIIIKINKQYAPSELISCTSFVKNNLRDTVLMSCFYVCSNVLILLLFNVL